ncbi:hypothetical protein Tco_0221920, partial [Tanacetum coccineum]
EDSLKLKELMELCTNLQQRVLDLEKTKTTQQNEIASLKRRVKKLEHKKVSVQDDADAKMFDVGTLTGDEVFALQEVADKDVNLIVDEVTLAQALAALKSVKPKVKGVVIEEPSVPVSAASASIKVSVATTTTAIIPTPRKGIIITELGTPTITRSSQQPSLAKVQDKGKGIMVEPEPMKPTKNKVQIMLDEEIAIKLQAEIDEAERIARAEEEKINEANIAWDDIQAKVDANYQLAERLQAKEQEQFTIKEKATLFKELLEQRRKHSTYKRAEEKRNKPPTKTQQKKTTITYLKNIKDLVEGSSKRAGEELEQESTKKQKVDEDKDTAELQSLIEVIPDEEEVAIDVVPLATKVFSQMLKSFTREDLEDLYKLVKAKYESTRPVEDLDLVLWNDLKTMFEPHVEDEIWKLQQRYKVLSWKLFDSCGVHCLSLQSGMIYMLVEKRYPLTPPTITDMLNKKLQGRIVGIKSFLMLFGVTAALIDVNAAQSKLVLLENFNENYSKCLRLLGRRIHDIDADEDITLVNDQDDADMFDKSVKPKVKANVVEEPSVQVSAASTKVSAATTITTATIPTPRKGIVITELGTSTTTTTISSQPL